VRRTGRCRRLRRCFGNPRTRCFSPRSRASVTQGSRDGKERCNWICARKLPAPTSGTARRFADPGERKNRGRGRGARADGYPAEIPGVYRSRFVVALEPHSGELPEVCVGRNRNAWVPPISIRDAWGYNVSVWPREQFVWCTPSFMRRRAPFLLAPTRIMRRGNRAGTSTADTQYACAVIALTRWRRFQKGVTQINPGDVWHRSMRGYDPKTGRYLDQPSADTPRVFTILWNGVPTLVIGFGCKNAGIYRAGVGRMILATPLSIAARPPSRSCTRQTNVGFAGLLGGPADRLPPWMENACIPTAWTPSSWESKRQD